MIAFRFCYWVVLFSLVCWRSYADPLLQKSEIGQYYPAARESLIKAGDVPVIQGNLQYNCDMVEDVCSLYPEEMDCAINVVGKPVICAFEWKSKKGQRYSITTAGEDPQKLLVTYIDPTPTSLLTDDSIR